MDYSVSGKAKNWDNIHSKYNQPKHREDGSHFWLLPIQYHNTNDLYQWAFIAPHRAKVINGVYK